ncbi:MAG TPA: cupin domain-containing protein [Solirubrobacterales bacterium]|jgi:quercetin dioxygenase-like cupin family protein|nr:cupin domain-containing protein [Solirubrobacterales bacterium]
MAANYTIKHRDEFERMEGSGDCTWLLARKGLDTKAFGYNLVEIAPGGQIPEHDEAQSGQVELYVILEGEAVMRLDGEDHPAPAGTFASIEPAATRTILNRSEGTVTAMLIGVEPDGGYKPMSWA